MLFVTYTDQNPAWLYLWMLSEYHPYLWHPSTGLAEGNGQEDQCFDAHVFMCDAPAAFSYVFFFHRQGMGKSGVSGLPKPVFLCWFGSVGHFSLQQWKLCRMLPPLGGRPLRLVTWRPMGGGALSF